MKMGLVGLRPNLFHSVRDQSDPIARSRGPARRNPRAWARENCLLSTSGAEKVRAWKVGGKARARRRMIVCVAVVGQQNNPLYLQSFTGADDALKLHHIVHCSLDVVDERVNNPKRSGTTLNEAFLGLLYPTESYKVYGYLTNTKVKFILVMSDPDVRDADARNFFRKFHAAYADAVSNPFHVPGKKITSKYFEERVSGIVETFGSGMST